MKPQPNRHLFTAPEMEAGSGVSHRNFVFLAERDLLPPAEVGGGKGRSRAWAMRGLSWMATVGAIHGSGIDLLLAAKLVHAAIFDLESSRGHLWSNLESILRSARKMPTIEEVPGGAYNDYWMHRWIKRNTDSYVERQSIKTDATIEIADKAYCYEGAIWSPPYSGSGFPGLCRVSLVRGGDVEVVTPLTEAGYSAETPYDGSEPIPDRILEEYRQAYRNSVGLIRVNISLAIRNALDAVERYRAETEA